jgi:hypothetical protein
MTPRIGCLLYASFFVVDLSRGPGRTRSNRLGSQTSQQDTMGSEMIYETMKGSRTLERTWCRVGKNNAKDIAPTRCHLNKEVSPFAIIVLGKGWWVAEWREGIICIPSPPKAAMPTSIVFFFAVHRNLIRISCLPLLLSATLLPWLS